MADDLDSLNNINGTKQALSADQPKTLNPPSQFPIKGVNAQRIGGKRARCKGYPQHTTELSHAETKEIGRLMSLCEKDGIPLNLVITIKKDGINDNKQPLREGVSKVMKYLRTRGIPHYGITVYEKNPYDPERKSELHAHHMFHCPKGYIQELKCHFNSDPNLRVTNTHSGSFGYLTKQRQSLPPQADTFLMQRKNYRFFQRRAGEFIKGKRWTVSSDLKKRYPTKTRIPDRRCIAVPWTPSKIIIPPLGSPN